MNNEFHLIEVGLSALKYGLYEDKQKALNLIMQSCKPEVKNAAVSRMVNQFRMNSRNTSVGLGIQDLNINLKTYCEILWLQIQKQQEISNIVSFQTMQILYEKSQSYRADYVLYQDATSTFQVSDLLDAISYALDFMDIVFDINTEKYSNYINVLKGFDRYLNNKEQERNILKDLGYVIEVFSAISNYFETDVNTKKINKMASTSINLALKFFAG